MIAKISTGKSIQGMLNYNEQKVKKGTGNLISANGYIDQIDTLSFYDKLEAFTRLTEKNQRTKTNAVHISLSFSPDDKVDDLLLQSIADRFMEGIGFEDQPYLVYRHYDTNHPHVHIVTTNIQEDGSRINMHNLGKTKSEIARKQIEQDYQLIKAEAQTKTIETPLHIEKVSYGNGYTKATLSGIVTRVVKDYKYGSLAELNAILGQFNVNAYRGEPGSRQYENGGMVYSITDDEGNRIGVPIKASSLNGRPTLKSLQKRFERNKAAKGQNSGRVKETIDSILNAKKPESKEAFREALKKQGIAAIFRTNAEGRTYGVTFVDNVTRSAFKGSDLGKGYSANALLNRIEGEPVKKLAKLPIIRSEKSIQMSAHKWQAPNLVGIHELLGSLTSGYAEEDIAYGFKKRPKTKGKRL